MVCDDSYTGAKSGAIQGEHRMDFKINQALTTMGICAVVLAGVVAQPLMSASAKTQVAQTEAPPRTITVVGIGKASSTPDIARVTLGVDVVNAKLSTALTEVNKKTNDVIAALKEAGVEDKDIRTVEFNVIPQQAYGPNGPGPITGYRVMNSVRVTIRTLDDAGTILEQAVGAGANAVQNLTFTIDDPKPVETDARKNAMADAKFKAEALATEAGATVGRVLTISEIISGGGPAPMFQNAALAEGVGGGGVSIAPGMQDVQVQVQVMYEIE
jgi:uncharacterized protein YggE